MNEIDICSQLTRRPLLLNPQDFDLDNCGVPQVPAAARYVDFYKVYAYSTVLGAAGSGTDILYDEKKVVDCNSDFILHKISPLGPEAPTAPTGYYARFQWPNGRYSSQALQDIFTVNGVVLTKDCNGDTQGIRIPAGRNIGIALQNLGAESVNVTILFEGVARFYLCARRRNGN